MLIVRWRKLWVTAGFSLAIIAGLLSSPGAVTASATNSTTSPAAGQAFLSLALDSDGNPVVSYRLETSLQMLHCDDANCAGAGDTVTTPAPAANSGQYSSLVLDASGNPVIAHRTGAGNNDMHIVHCDDPACDGVGESVETPDTSGNTGAFSSLALDPVGYPVLVYHKGAQTHELRLMHCNDVNCAGTNEFITTLATDSFFGGSLALDSSYYPVVSYRSGGGDLKILHCNDVNCTGDGDVLTTPDAVGDLGRGSSLALEPVTNNPVVSYFEGGSGDLRILRCDDPNCAGDESANIATPDSTGVFSSYWSSIVLDSLGNPIVAYFDYTPYTLKVLRCGNPTCTSGNTITTPDTSGDRVGQHVSMKLDAAGNPVISYTDATNAKLKILHCSNPSCGPDGDGDGCTEDQENGLDETIGGLRDPKNPFDFYDVLGGGGGPPDQIIDLPNDILGVILHFSPLGYTPGTPALVGSGIYDDFDRGPKVTGLPWNMTAPDGVIDLPNDILGVILQHNHSCQ